MTASNRILAGTAAALALALIATVAIKLTRTAPETVTPVAAESPCDLQHGACTARLPGGGRLTFAIEPRPIPVLKPIQLRVQVEDLRPRAVEVAFSGTDMDMGVNRTVLKEEGEGRYAGPGMLPVCVRDRMNWRATVLVTTADAKLSVPFLFETVRN